MHGLTNDLRRALRSLARRPGFAALVVGTMAVGIGVNVCLAGYLSHFLWPAVQAPDPQAVHWLVASSEEAPRGNLSLLDWRQVEAAETGLRQHAAYRIFAASVVAPERTLHGWGFAVSGAYFDLFGARPQAGRLLHAADDRPGAERVVVLADAYWRKYFHADPEVVGTTLDLDGEHRYTVVGVTPRGFQGHGFTLSLFVPLATAAPLLNQPPGGEGGPVNALARLAPGTAVEQAEAALAAVAAGLDEERPRAVGRRFELVPASRWSGFAADEPVLRRAYLLAGAVAFLLLLACANVANLVLARSAGRERELAVHVALGSGRRRIALQLLAEGLVLSVAGGVLGLGVATALTAVLEGYLLGSNPVGMGDWGEGSSLVGNPAVTVPAFLLLTLGTGTLFGLVPLRRLRHLELARALAAGGRGVGGGRGPRGLLVGAQVGLAVLLLIGAGLFVRNLHLALERDAGFEVDGLSVAALYLPGDRREQGSEAIAGRYREILEAARELGGVRAAALASRIPFTPHARQVEAAPRGSRAVLPLDYDIVSDGYFATLGLPLLQGRGFGPGDDAASPPVVVVNRAAAERLWPTGPAVGETVVLTDPRQGAAKTWQVIGVAGDSLGRGPLSALEPMVYFSFHQKVHRRLALLVRSGGPVSTPLRRLLRERFPEIAVVDLVPLSEQLRRTLSEPRMVRDLAAAFGLLGLGLAALGVFGLLSYGVSRRVREMGIRQAVGAAPADLRRLVLAETARLVAPGIAAGLGAAWVLVRFLESQLFELDARDPATFLGVAAVVAAVALGAALLPAARAAAIEPQEALRQE